MKKDLYRAFMKSMRQVVTTVKGKSLLCPVVACASCGQPKPCRPVTGVGFVCLDCYSKSN